MTYLIVALVFILIVLVKVYRYYCYLLANTHKSRRSTRTNYIYFFRGRNENPYHIKIGRTNDLEHRMKAHRTANPYGVVILCSFATKNDVKAERFLHQYFAKDRISSSGEWFRWSIDLFLVMWLLNDVNLTRRINACTRLK